MIRKKSLVTWMIALLAVLMVSCSSGVAKVTTYSPEQLTKIADYTTNLVVYRDRMDRLNELIQKKQWVNVDTYIHGPLGALRGQATYLTQNLLLPKDKDQVLNAAKEIFEHLEKIDVAANDGNYNLAVTNYQEAVKDLENFLNQIPKSS
ncbi:MAG: photosystem II protein PsbQ [Microcoleaceae cyanobacterium]